MTEKDTGVSPMRWVVVAVIAIASAGGVALAIDALLHAGAAASVRDALASAPVPTAAALALPFVAAWIAALVTRGSRTAASVATRERAASNASRSERRADTSAVTRAASSRDTGPAPSGAAALQLLAVLQQEGRFVDFVEEDLTSYSDEQIGAAVRSIHDGCRSALRERLELHPILAAAEGATVTVEPGFDPAAVRVTGNVRGEPPYRGVVRHPGWRSDGVKLPEWTGDGDATILAPAEVEVL